MVQFHPFRDVAEEYNYTRVDPGMFNWGRGGGGWGSPNFGSEKTVELFCGKLPGGLAGYSLQEANRDVLLDRVAFSRLE